MNNADPFLASVDEDLAASIARSMGYDGYSRIEEQEPVRLPEFGPRKIHSTPEIEPDPLEDDANLTPPSGAMVLGHSITVSDPVYVHGFYAIGPKPQPRKERTDRKPREPRQKPQWEQKFHERRPTETPKAGRPKRKRGKHRP